MNASLVRRVALVTLLGTAALALTGCFAFKRIDSTSPDSRTVTKTIPVNGTTQLDARFTMPVGVLTVDGETNDLADMAFSSTNPEWLPVVDTTRSVVESNTVTSLEVAVPEDLNFLKGTRDYEWVVHLSPEIPSNLRLELGAGESTIDLSDVDVRDLRVTTGVGETKIDLSGPRAHDVNAQVECGIGEVTIRVPADVGVQVSGRQEGIGGLSADGFTMTGDQLTNAAWATSPVKMYISLTRGVGDVRIETVD